MKKIKFLLTVIVVLAGTFVYVSCQNSEIEPIEEQESSQELKGVQEYRAALINLSNGVNSIHGRRTFTKRRRNVSRGIS